MSTFEDNFKAALGSIAKARNPLLDVVEVTGFYEEIEPGYGCDTCGPGDTVKIEVWYKDSAGKSRCVDINSDISDLLPEIAEYEGWGK